MFKIRAQYTMSYTFGLENGTMEEIAMHTEAIFARASGQLCAKPPVFRKHAARTII
jgi:hypothetical protein